MMRDRRRRASAVRSKFLNSEDGASELYFRLRVQQMCLFIPGFDSLSALSPRPAGRAAAGSRTGTEDCIPGSKRSNGF